MDPFTIRYNLTRRQRLVELFPWMPALAGSIGFCVGIVYLANVASAWFSLFLLLPILYYRGLITLVVELTFRPGKRVEVTVEAEELIVCIGRDTRRLPLEGIIQVFRAEGCADWTVLHLDGTSITIPAHAISAEQLDYLKGFALRAARERWATNPPV